MRAGSRSIHEILRQYWGYSSFRPLQEDIIQSVLDGNDTLALMPTGGGKSLCYQVPAMFNDGICLVISPLIALMKDQVENLRKKNITAYAIYSGMSRKEVIRTFITAAESNCKFLYVSPERLETSLFKEYLPSLNISLIAVDEAHCVAQWGYDFRPPYLRIADIRTELPGIPLLALTASATPEVQLDICEKLTGPQHGDWKTFRQSFERANLSYSVFQVDSKINKIIDVLKKVKGTAIVYCKSRKRTQDIAALLQLQEIHADFYHAGLAQDERTKKQEDWINNKTRVIVCTNAFGMGIDKPDVRVVVHADVPDCLENYYQEAGRAGRDGKIAYAVLLYNEPDLHDLEEMGRQRFPSLGDIREVYQSVANYLQLPTGVGEGEYYDFDLPDMLKKFRLSAHLTLYSLKALEQEGWLSFNEQVFMPAICRFTIGKGELYLFEQSHPDLEPLIKALLRGYEGIFDYPTAISEKLLAGMLKKDDAFIKQQLSVLVQYGIIDYHPQKDKPQLLLLRNRIRVEDLQINVAAYEKRKQQFLRRMRQMIEFVQEQSECRSKIIAGYFGDDKVPACGVCDNCLRTKASPLSKEEFKLLHHRIINMVRYEPLDPKELLQRLGNVEQEKAWKVIDFLQSENKIELDAGGKVRLK